MTPQERAAENIQTINDCARAGLNPASAIARCHIEGIMRGTLQGILGGMPGLQRITPEQFAAEGLEVCRIIANAFVTKDAK